ncbi:MAG: TetR/AcrR family transcriptional regulator [Pseudomonadota bacterium]|nr:hypothetical protein [Pseudomonadales bacterium]MDY6921335.1 TetR/AcrR family transcriptional regulator [Pseudomonadota bacterium]
MQAYDFEPKKWPRQARSRATFEALVEACTQLLAERGYQGVTTNHVAERAGVAIASLYEYFPNKDALVAQVAEQLVQRVMRQLSAEVPRVLRQKPGQAAASWIAAIYRILRRERALLMVFHYQVPYTNRLPAVQRIRPRLTQFTSAMYRQAGEQVHLDSPGTSLYLLMLLVSTTIVELIVNPPSDMDPADVLADLAQRVTDWVR